MRATVPPTSPRSARPGRLAGVMLLAMLGACRGPTADLAQPTPAPAHATVAPSPTPAEGLTEAEAQTLSSLERIDPYPLYTMQHFAPHDTQTSEAPAPDRRWSCSLFAALGDPSSRLYGRNFDWDYSPAVLLFTDPPDGYASVSIVDIAYLFDGVSEIASLDERPLENRRALLWAPHLPFDGMNEHGLAVGMASVPSSEVPHDPALPTVDDLELIRWMLDRARTVDEALDVLRGANVSWGGGPPIHYLIADAGGHSALVEYIEGQMVVLPAAAPWHLATNFYVSASGAGPIAPAGFCPRYDHLLDTLSAAGGVLQLDQGLDLLQRVSNETTQWSVIYDLSQRSVHVVMGGEFQTVYTFELGD